MVTSIKRWMTYGAKNMGVDAEIIADVVKSIPG